MGGTYSKEADIFAFAMVVIEVCHDGFIACRTLADWRFILIQVFTGALPFDGVPSHGAMFAIMQGKRPLRPTYPTFTENLWTLVQRCWDHDPHLRPDVLEVLQVLPTPSVSRLFRRSRFVDFTVSSCSDPPTWKRLVSYRLEIHERLSLIVTIFSDPGEVEVVGQLSGYVAQTFIDTIIEVSAPTLLLPPKDGWLTSANSHVMSVRCWIAFHNRSAGGVCALYIGSVVIRV